MRPAPPLLAALAVLLALAAPLHAEDEPPAPKGGEPTPLRPAPELKPIRLPFVLADLTPADGDRPAGWSPATSALPETAPTTAALLRVARTAGVDDARLAARCIPVTKGTGEAAVQGTLGYLVIDVEATTLTPKLAELARTHGWTLTSVGVPSAVLVTWASDDAAEGALRDWQVATAVRNLCAAGWALLEKAQQGFDPRERQFQSAKGQAMIAAARETLPESGYVNAILAQLVGRDATRALAFARKAVRKDAPAPPPDALFVTAAFTVAGSLLTTGTAEDLPEVVAVLERAVAAEEAARNPFHRFGNRYNLACALARQGKVDAAFPHLDESLRYLKKAWEEEQARTGGGSRLAYPDHYEHAKTRDGDLDALRKDPRFAALMARHDPAPAAQPGGDGK